EFPMSASLGMPTAVPCAASEVAIAWAESQSRFGVRASQTASASSCAPIPTPSMMQTTTGPRTPAKRAWRARVQSMGRDDALALRYAEARARRELPPVRGEARWPLRARVRLARATRRDPARHALPRSGLGHAGEAAGALPPRRRPDRANLGSLLP